MLRVSGSNALLDRKPGKAYLACKLRQQGLIIGKGKVGPVRYGHIHFPTACMVPEHSPVLRRQMRVHISLVVETGVQQHKWTIQAVLGNGQRVIGHMPHRTVHIDPRIDSLVLIHRLRSRRSPAECP